jgi:UDP-N-acetylmuramoyl-L-alanyl-D-glutamate--2,6-diaminopimelate ligase
MLHKIKSFFRKLTPEFILASYHYSLAVLADIYYGHPSGKLVIIGITGTKGKTSTANFVWSVLNAAKIKTGLIGTANIKLGNRELMNEFHMTMPGPFVLQKFLSQMLKEGVTHVAMEATSEGMKLNRHVGIDFDVAIFTNLTPEHLPSHGGSFEKYKQEKTKLFKALSKSKTIKNFKLEKIIITNKDSEFGEFYSNFPADKKIFYGINNQSDVQASDIHETTSGVDFKVKGFNFHLSLLGGFNVYNALPAIALGKAFGLPLEVIEVGIADLKLIPGRMEIINQGQNFTVIVDYAHEKISINALLDTARKMAGQKKVIILLGAEGGGRDKAKRAPMGEAAAKKANYIICSNVDPYEDDPYPIANDIAVAAERFGKKRDENLFVILDRREGITKALSLAQDGDIVLITGKGAEQSIVIDGKTFPWDDRKIVREELNKMK